MPPIADHHQHLISPALAALLASGSGSTRQINADDVVGLLDAAGIRRALVLSTGYMYGSPARSVVDERARVQAENDWTGAQVGRYPDRLVGFGSFNPLKEYALDELARCAASPDLGRGIKLHFGNSDVQLDDPGHVERLRRVFGAANERHLAIVVHLRASISRNRPYGAAQARAFLEQLLPLAPDVSVQVAHLAGAGPGYDDPPAHHAMAVLAEAVERADQGANRLLFDVATVADLGVAPRHAELVARLIRQVGIERVLYGSDAATDGNLQPREGWAAFCRLPLTETELARIASNAAPYLLSSR